MFTLNRRFLAACLVMVLGAFSSRADEGMWLPFHLKRLNYADMQKNGLKLTADELYSINNSSLKDAIVRMGQGFCTGEIISKEGLLLTNHHCGYDLIQKHSTVENDYLSKGFWAMTRAEEKPNPGLTVSFLVKMDDVTPRMLAKLKDLPETARRGAIGVESQAIVKEYNEGGKYDVQVKSYFNDNEFYVLVYETYKDVRLVGAPPSSIGKFGGDTDNWMWPRHTGDFSMFRVYTGPDGKPAEYSPNNIPLKPRHYLPVSMSGVREQDFAMIWGYPGTTNRYLTSWGVKLAYDIANPTRIKIRDAKLKTMKEGMDADPKVRIQYASKYAQIANYWKYFIGQNQGIKRLDVIGQKQKQEADFTAWVNADATRKSQYGEALGLIENGYKNLFSTRAAETCFQEAGTGCEAVGLAGSYNYLLDALKKGESAQAAAKQVSEAIKGEFDEHFKDYNRAVDQQLLVRMIQMYQELCPVNQQPSILKTIAEKYKGDVNKYAAEAFAKTNLADKAKAEALLAKPDAKALEKDPIITIYKSFYDAYMVVALQTQADQGNITKGNRLFVAGLLEMNQGKKAMAPNANSTMRCTYGKVLDYEARDAVKYNYFTTAEGILEKEDNTNEEFEVPAKLHELIAKKDFGRYADENGQLKVCFLSNTDITGGNSGSPVINAKGQLIGLAFDGNWEAMSGDLAFEPKLQRTISNDIRYILFIIDKYAGAKHLVDEMTLVYNEPEKPAVVEAPVAPPVPAVPAAPVAPKAVKKAAAPKAAAKKAK